MKEYEAPYAEFIKFKDDRILTTVTGSNGCQCWGEIVQNSTKLENGEIPDPCYSTTYDSTELTIAEQLIPGL